MWSTVSPITWGLSGRRSIEALAATAAATIICLPAARAADDPADSVLNEVVVTGSRISGTAPVGSAIQTLGRQEIETSGAINTTQVLQELPQVYNLGISESSRGQSGGSGNITYGTTVNLRGIGPYTTLTLIDGHRAVPQGTTGFAVDPSVVPALGLQRVEIVDDGASALYGSDAVAGVVNLILRRHFEGVETNAGYGTADDYLQRHYGLVAGHDWGSGQVTLSYEYAYHSALSGIDRDFYRGDLRSRGGNDFRVPQCNPGNIVVGGKSYAIPAGGVTPASAGSLLPNTTNLCDNLKLADILPEIGRHGGMLTFNQELTDGIALFGDAFVTKREFKNRTAPPASSLSVPATNAYFVAPPGTTPTSETVNYSFINDYPTGYTSGFSRSYEATAGATFQLPKRWKFEADYTYGYNKDESVTTNLPYAPALTAALASADPAKAFNPFGGGNNAALAPGILIGNFDAPGESSLRFYEAKFDGPIIDLPAGDLRAAIGYEGQSFHVLQTNGMGSLLVPIVTQAYHKRQVNSFYAEVFVPVFSEKNALPGLRELTLDVAGRTDRYSDVGRTTNPKVGINWSPVGGLTLRGSYGKSFRAPTISQIYGNTNSLFVQNYADPTCNCVRQGVARSGGNPQLKPETARTYTGGLDLVPAIAPDAKLSLTYFDIDYENQVTSYLSDLTLLGREATFAGTSVIQRNPSAAFIAEQVAATGYTGLLPNPVTVFVDGRSQNLGITTARGVDMNLSYRLPTDHLGQFLFDVNGTYFTTYRTAVAPAAPVLDMLNTIYNPLRLKARGEVGWTLGPISSAVFVNYQHAYDNILSKPVQTVGSYITTDLHLAYDTGDTPSNRLWKNLTVSLDATNLFDRDPPFVNIAESANGGGGYDSTLTNPVGRILMLTLDKKF
jgi:iron complex outermembrane recepter protein